MRRFPWVLLLVLLVGLVLTKSAFAESERPSQKATEATGKEGTAAQRQPGQGGVGKGDAGKGDAGKGDAGTDDGQQRGAAQNSIHDSGAAQGEASPSEALDRARVHFETALAHYAEGRYRQAIIELRRAHALDPSGKDLLYNLAVVHEKLGEIGPALSYYRRVHELEHDGPERDRIAATIRRLEGAREELIRARLAEGNVTAGENDPASRDSQPEPVVLATAGIAALAVVVGAVFGARAIALEPGPSDGTKGGRDISDVRADARAAHRSAIVADVSFLVGLVSGSVASVLYLGRVEPTRAAEPEGESASRAAVPAPTWGVDLGVRF